MTEGLHILESTRAADPIVWFCEDCSGCIVQALNEEPKDVRCGECGKAPCDECLVELENESKEREAMRS